jgi:hypothetical protein
MQRKEADSRFWAPWDGPELPVPWSTVAVGKKNCTRRARREAEECILIGDREPQRKFRLEAFGVLPHHTQGGRRGLFGIGCGNQGDFEHASQHVISPLRRASIMREKRT